mmetsp:Transcript_20791/g.29188  ORF Transcript_20791/g.29188 Transcript_20791/m.29188 type:complete len:120 (-) Transcript_20791:929-1288(-)
MTLLKFVVRLKDEMALKTTIVKLSKAGFNNCKNSKPKETYSSFVHYFPLALHYLAVCISRVTNRAKNSHHENLDGGTKLSCMVVIKFYCFYQNMTAEELIDAPKRNIESGDNTVVNSFV